MKIEVTDKEAFDIHYNRYMAEKKKRLLILLAASIAFTIICFGFMGTRNAGFSWWAMAIMAPVMVKAMLTAKASGNYARKKMGKGVS